jgi:hypothetical protein
MAGRFAVKEYIYLEKRGGIWESPRLSGIFSEILDITYKGVVWILCVNRNPVAKALPLNFVKAQERHMLASVFSSLVVYNGFRVVCLCRVVFRVVSPIRLIGYCPMLAIIVKALFACCSEHQTQAQDQQLNQLLAVRTFVPPPSGYCCADNLDWAS